MIHLLCSYFLTTYPFQETKHMLEQAGQDFLVAQKMPGNPMIFES